MKSERVLLLTSSLAQGGAEVVVKQLALALRRTGRTVGVVSMKPPSAFVTELEAAGVMVISLGMKAGPSVFTGVARLLRCIRSFRPHLIHAHMFHASILARFVTLIVGTPCVCTVHSEIESSHNRKSAFLREWIYRLTDPACTITTVVSSRIRERYVRKRITPRVRIRVIENGINPEHYQPCPKTREEVRAALGCNDCFVWMAVGRLENPKDYPTMIRAFGELRKQWTSSRLVIVGEGRLRGEVDELIRRADLQSSIVLLGARTDVPDLLNGCDALVLSSEWEGGPLVLLEAGAAGRPAVATDVGAACQIVIPDETGFLVPPRDYIALSRAMERLMATPSRLLVEMGNRARAHVVERFSLPRVHERYASLYEEVLTAR